MFDTKAKWWKCCETLHSGSDVCRPALCIFQFVITNYNDTVCMSCHRSSKQTSACTLGDFTFWISLSLIPKTETEAYSEQ